MKHFALVAVSVVLTSLFAACGPAESAVSEAPLTMAQPLQVSLERGSCEGRRSTTIVDLCSGTNTVRFTRSLAGVVVFREVVPVEPEVTQQLLQLFSTSPFNDLGNYIKRDLPDRNTVTVIYGDKMVTHHLGDLAAPAELAELEGAVDALLDTWRWINADEQGELCTAVPPS